MWLSQIIAFRCKQPVERAGCESLKVLEPTCVRRRTGKDGRIEIFLYVYFNTGVTVNLSLSFDETNVETTTRVRAVAIVQCAPAAQSGRHVSEGHLCAMTIYGSYGKIAVVRC